MANTRTENVNRGTPSFITPEIETMIDAGADDLRRIDMWAYGMVVYCVLNPDAKFPFYFDAKMHARNVSIPSALMYSRFILTFFAAAASEPEASEQGSRPK